jgi:hypothetical protein
LNPQPPAASDSPVRRPPGLDLGDQALDDRDLDAAVERIGAIEAGAKGARLLARSGDENAGAGAIACVGAPPECIGDA